MKIWFGYHIHSLEITVTLILWHWSPLSDMEVSKTKQKSFENNHIQYPSQWKTKIYLLGKPELFATLVK